MQARHVAYGLDLRCAFALPGMGRAETERAVADKLPSLALELVGLGEIEEVWSGSEGLPEWTGQLGDGRSLAIERGVCGDVLFTYGNRARFRLDASHKRLECAPLRSGLHWQQVLLGRVLPNVAIVRGYEALHASAVDSPEGVIAVAAPSGAGKTTLALELMGRGWPLFADDVLTLSEGPAGVLAHPGTPHMNVAMGSSETLLAPGEVEAETAPTDGGTVPEQFGATLGVLAGERWIAVREAAREPRPVRIVCLLERSPGLPLQGRVVPSSPLPLAPYMLGLLGGPERERRRFACYAELMSGATLVRLTCDPGVAPADLADQVERALERRPVLVGGAT